MWWRLAGASNWEGGNSSGNSCNVLIWTHQESQTGVMFTQERQTLDEHFKELPKWQEGSALSCTNSFLWSQWATREHLRNATLWWMVSFRKQSGQFLMSCYNCISILWLGTSLSVVLDKENSFAFYSQHSQSQFVLKSRAWKIILASDMKSWLLI